MAKRNQATAAKPARPLEDNPETPQEPTPEKGRVNLAFDTNPDGTLDFSSMREKTKEKVRQVFSDPKFQDFIGAKPNGAAPAPAVEMFHPAMVSGMIDMLGTMEGLVFPMFFKNIPPQIFQKVFTYSPEEKALLVPPATAVLNKYVPEWLLKYQAEITLANILISMTVIKCKTAIELSKLHTNVVQMPPAEPPSTAGPN